MPKTHVSFFNILTEFAQTFVLSVSKLLMSMPLKNDSLHLGVWYKMFAHLAFSYTKHELFVRKAPVATYWMHFKLNLICIKSFLHTKMQQRNSIPYERIPVATLLYLMFINDVTVPSSSLNLQLLFRIKFPTKRIFQILNIWKTNRMMLFCN